MSFNSDTSISYRFGTPFLAAISNQKGEFQIGKRKYLITNDGKLISYPYSRKDISNIRNYSSTDTSIGIQVRSYKLYQNSKGVTTSSHTWDPFNGIVKQELRVNGSRRLHVEMWRECIPSAGIDDPDYFLYYVKLLQESKKIFGWGANNTDYHITNGSIKIQYIPSPWGVPTIYTAETAPKVTTLYSLTDYHRYDTKGSITVGLYDGYSFGLFIEYNALISSGGVPSANFYYGNTYP